MLDAGGNVYYLAKLAGVLGLGVQDLGALQTGVTVGEFKEHLLEVGRPRSSSSTPCRPLPSVPLTATCQEMKVDHGFWVPLSLLWPKRPDGLRVLPIHINTVQHPMASAARCQGLGAAVGDALRAWPTDDRVVIVGSGGLSHRLEGRRAGFINPRFDELCLDALVSGDTDVITRHTIPEIVELAGSQGVEVVNWLAMRGAVGGSTDGGGTPVSEMHRNYHIPISNTAAAVQVLAPEPERVIV